MNFNKKIIPFIWMIFHGFLSHGQTVDSNLVSITWTNLAKGIDYCETDAPIKSIVNDSKLSILKIQPQQVEFLLLSASEFDNKPRTASGWADSFDLNIVINAGMYNLSKTLLSKGYLQNYTHKNNPQIHPSYNTMIAFNPKDSLTSNFNIFDLTCTNWQSIKSDYHCFAQGMRMIDCNGNALGWNKRNQSCSMLVAAIDEIGNVYFVFTRSPYTHNEMIHFLLSFPFKIRETIYMEGGPETSFYINIDNTRIEKVGSYVSTSYANDDNDHFWNLPNVIGMKVKK